MDASRIGIIFDCDGTLLDSMGAWLEVEDELARRAGIQLTRAESDLLTTLTIPEAGDFFHERCGLGSCGSDAVLMMDELMLDYYRTRAIERPGALAFVRGLAERGVRMSVASSSPQPYLQAGLALTGFAPYLDHIVSVDDVGRSKREPAVYDYTRDLMGTPLETTWGFEDSAYALRTLRGARYRTVGIYDNDLSGTFEELAALSDHAIKSFEELDSGAFPR
ncbi:MAG: HAD family phosphatase [Gordonibacter sp.]|uniref:HAD family hydrolase n=1 Tax=Gordonibacter sp. TaxID=1968902 RepID=UPI002FCC9A14